MMANRTVLYQYLGSLDAKIREMAAAGMTKLNIARSLFPDVDIYTSRRSHGGVRCQEYESLISYLRHKNIIAQNEPSRSWQGPEHPSWKGGRQISAEGYVYIWVKDHPHSKKHYVFEHRLVMEAHLGRYLLQNEVVHHKDANKLNNDISNLQLFDTNGEHLKHELTGRLPEWSDEGLEKIRQGVILSAVLRRERILDQSSPDA